MIENHNPLPYGLRSSYRNLKSENSEGYVQPTPETSMKLYVHEFGFCIFSLRCPQQ
jgi:hypothetical protein